MKKIVYIGCGCDAIEGADNLDNSFSVKLAYKPFLLFVFKALHLLSTENIEFIKYVKEHNVTYGTAKKLKYDDDSVDVIYTSHMLEHLYTDEIERFISESYRALKYDGVLRIVIPDLRKNVEMYLNNQDADQFVDSLLLRDYGRKRPTLKEKLKMFMFGERMHKYMYDEESLKKLILSISEFDVINLKPGETTIDFSTGIDLTRKSDESLYIECIKRSR
ncbi:class I SAM-dependent methyltransferase [Butyrivibrio proteoclasticus]|uniref:class I SAM-dependent methyltransferase n=1 Tax=Butyrivibrio proteoclasticus TaxID=43305 RepID=UPI000479DCD1|nr:methyltransferase domain-containing protein [Butyrivibrio proteoclasticus]